MLLKSQSPGHAKRAAKQAERILGRGVPDRMADHPKLTKGQKRRARIAAMERAFERTSQRATDAMNETQAEIERSRDLLEDIAHLGSRAHSSEDTPGQ